MSRIDTKNNAAAAHAQAMGGLSRGASAEGAAGSAAAKRVFKTNARQETNAKVSSKRAKKLHAPSDVSDTDLQPLMGKKRDDVIAGLSRILMSINDYESSDGEDDTTRLCKMMLSEHVRRLTLVQQTQIVSDDLRGSA